MTLNQKVDKDFVEENEGKYSHFNLIHQVDKIEVTLNAVGRAPKLKQTKFKLKKSYTFQHLISFVKGQLEKAQAMTPKDSLVFYQT